MTFRFAASYHCARIGAAPPEGGVAGYDAHMTASPFPGMDPYLEPHWLDVHAKLATYAADDLNNLLPADLIASIGERVAVETEQGDERLLKPDARVFEPPVEEDALEVAPAGGAVAAPFRLLAQVEPITERFIKVIEAGTERLVTVIEFVSPTNKRGGEGLQAFRSKRAELLASGVNFVEIDLVRAGDWHALLRPHRCARRAMSLYRATIRVPAEPGYVYLYPLPLREGLRELHVPLRLSDQQVTLALQSLVGRAYVNGRYARRLDYRRPPEPPLEPEDAAWADEILRSAGRM